MSERAQECERTQAERPHLLLNRVKALALMCGLSCCLYFCWYPITGQQTNRQIFCGLRAVEAPQSWPICLAHLTQQIVESM